MHMWPDIINRKRFDLPPIFVRWDSYLHYFNTFPCRDALTLSSLVELNSAGECAVYPMEEGDSSDLSDDEYC